MNISLLLGIVVGMVMGVTGAGGGVLAVPVLVAGMGLSMQQAAPIALVAVAGGAALGAVEGWRRGLVRYRAAFLMVAFGLPLTHAGVVLAQKLPQRELQILFSLVILIVALRTLWHSLPGRQQDARHKLATINPSTGRFGWTWGTGVLFAVIGSLAGFMAGLLGVGGGFVVVPALRRFTDVSMQGAVATSLMVVALLACSSILAMLYHGGNLPHPLTVLFVLATAVGMLAGRWALRRVSEMTVQRGFACFLIAIALNWLIKAFIAA